MSLHWTLPRAAQNRVVCFFRTSTWKESEMESASKKEATVSQNLLLKLLSHHVCHAVFIRSKSAGPAQAEEEGITQGHKHQDLGINWNHL